MKQVDTADTLKKYYLIEREKEKLHFGCGNKVMKGFINIDKRAINNEVIQWDLNKKLPFENNTFEYILTEQVLEHLYAFDEVMDELHRICKNNAIIEIKVPYTTHITADSSSHLARFTLRSFNHRTTIKGEHRIPNSKQFRIIHKELLWDKGWNPINHIGKMISTESFEKYCETTFLRYILQPRTIHFKLKVIK